MCVCQKYFNERQTMKNEFRKVGVGEIKLKSVITYGIESFFVISKEQD